MGCSVLGFKDVVVCELPNPDDPELFRVHKKGFAGEVKQWSADELRAWAGRYVLWHRKKFYRMPVLWSEGRKLVRVLTPKLRSHRADYYAWIKHLPLPEGGYWYLLTLTFYREIGLENSWKGVNRWTSMFLNRFRTFMRKKYGVNPSYLWVVESHKDGFPHVHILYRMPFIKELNIPALVEMFQRYWVDEKGNPLCAPNGVDVLYIGRDVQRVRDYVLKYLVKQHHKYWMYQELPDGRFAVRMSTVCIWLYRVRLFGMSQDIRQMLREKLASDKANKKPSDWVFYGTVSANRLHKLFYASLGIPYGYWLGNLPEVGTLEYEDKVLPLLVPSAFSSRASPSDVPIDDLMEHF
jgi:hypothetical protein